MGQAGVAVAMKTKKAAVPTAAAEVIRDMRRPVRASERVGIEVSRFFTRGLAAGRTPYDEVQWELRTASIGNDKGAVIFEQRDVEVPADWSQTATTIVVSKYFHGKMGSPERENSVRQLI
jgi:ribonucleoside-diphosphate reductase alpha chain